MYLRVLYYQGGELYHPYSPSSLARVAASERASPEMGAYFCRLREAGPEDSLKPGCSGEPPYCLGNVIPRILEQRSGPASRALGPALRGYTAGGPLPSLTAINTTKHHG